jgi:hypothetical protein
MSLSMRKNIGEIKYWPGSTLLMICRARGFETCTAAWHIVVAARPHTASSASDGVTEPARRRVGRPVRFRRYSRRDANARSAERAAAHSRHVDGRTAHRFAIAAMVSGAPAHSVTALAHAPALPLCKKVHFFPEGATEPARRHVGRPVRFRRYSRRRGERSAERAAAHSRHVDGCTAHRFATAAMGSGAPAHSVTALAHACSLFTKRFHFPPTARYSLLVSLWCDANAGPAAAHSRECGRPHGTSAHRRAIA